VSSRCVKIVYNCADDDRAEICDAPARGLYPEVALALRRAITVGRMCDCGGWLRTGGSAA
jgi:hypothetical protein